jgi:hypothetical protein
MVRPAIIVVEKYFPREISVNANVDNTYAVPKNFRKLFGPQKIDQLMKE